MADAADLPFDPVRVRLKIHELRKNLYGLEALLESYGLDVDSRIPAPPVSNSRPKHGAGTGRQRVHRRAGSRARSKQKPKLADLAVNVISKHGGRAHGKVIVAELRAEGYMLDVAHPDSNISTALSRDSRVQRAADARNTWVLKSAA